MSFNSVRLLDSTRGMSLFGSAAVGVVMSGAALAQGVGVEDDSSAPNVSGASLEEVVVTARRASESLSRVPLSITALSAQELAEGNIVTQADLQRGVPSLTVRSGQTDNDLTFALRGQGVDSYSGSRPAVLPYFNEVPLTSLSASNFYDLESIQVIKGPQGTLFGRNTTGGAILYTSAAPTDELEGYITGELGDYSSRKLEGAVNIPISDSVRFRVASNLQWRDGWQENVLTGQELGEIDRQSIRATLQWQPTDRFESTTLASYSSSEGSPVGIVPYEIYDCGATNNGIPLAPAAVACIYGPAFGPAYDVYQQATPGTSPEGITSAVAEQRELGMRKINASEEYYHDSEDWLAINTTTYDITPELTFKNIVSYSRSRSRDLYDPYGTGPYTVARLHSTLERQPGAVEGLTRDNKSYTLEPQLSGSAVSGDLTYIAGAFFSREELYYRAPFKFFDFRPVFPPVIQRDEFDYTDDSQAVYAQSTMDLSNLVAPGLSVTVGARYTWEQVEMEQGSFANTGVITIKETFRDPSWNLSLDYQVNDSVMVYVAQRGSFRAGGFSSVAPRVKATAEEGGSLFLPEQSRDVEIGAKFSGLVGSMPARANLAIYHAKITDMQRTLFTFLPADVSPSGSESLAVLTANVPTAKVSGVEIDGRIDLTDNLKFGASIAYTDARYTDGRVDAFGTVFDYGPVSDSPEWAGNVFAEITLPLPIEIGDMSIRGEVYAQSEQYFSNFNDTVSPGTRLPGYGIFNATVSWNRIMGSGLDGALFVKNASQKGYYTGGLSFSPLGTNGALPAEPRTFGISLTHNF